MRKHDHFEHLRNWKRLMLYHPLYIFTAAFFVFLAAAAGAGFVASDF